MSKKKAFIFDMDGVIVASEKMWEKLERGRFENMFGAGVAAKMGDTMGKSLGEIYEEAISLGATLSKQEFDNLFNQAALRVYSQSPISHGLDELVNYLKDSGWLLGLVSSSPMSWIEQVLPRLSWRQELKVVVSVNENKQLKPKPEPDGYLHILEKLGVVASGSLALEDSNPGIAAAKAAGLFTIGFAEHLPEKYQQVGADTTAQDMSQVLKIIKK
jgi:HAD superfamily hydrolase (TIGR01509 family)